MWKIARGYRNDLVGLFGGSWGGLRGVLLGLWGFLKTGPQRGVSQLGLKGLSCRGVLLGLWGFLEWSKGPQLQELKAC